MTRIEYLRRQRGLKQKDFATMVGDWPCNIAQVENGHRRPWPKMRAAIAAALDVEISDLFSDDGSPLMVDWKLPSNKDAI